MFFTAFLLVLARERGLLSQLLMRPFPALLGKLSYSIYMTHAAVMLVISLIAAKLGVFDPATAISLGAQGSVPAGLVSDLIAFAMLGAVILVSWGTYRWIETPSREWSRRKAARHGAPRAEAIAPTF